MKRQRTTKKKKSNTERRADAILTADWHIREDTPVCRTDNFWETQWGKVAMVSDLQRTHRCPVIHAGDLFHHWKPSPFLLTHCLIHLPDHFHTVYGNHDLPQHSMSLLDKSGVTTLARANKITILEDGHWNVPPNKGMDVGFYKKRKVGVWHTMTYTGKEPYPGCEAPEGHKLLSQFPQFDLIVTGDNHQTFVCTQNGRLLVNPGNLTRQTAADGPPVVFLYYAEDNTVEEVELDYSESAVSREHIDRKNERDGRIDAFITKLNEDWETVLDFKENLKRFAETNNPPEEVMSLVYKAIEHG